MVARVLLAGEGVELAADGVELGGDVERRTASVPLNSRCSRKWVAPASERRLVAGADAGPQTRGSSTGRRASPR